MTELKTKLEGEEVKPVELSDIEIKALIYDEMVKVEVAQRNIQQLNAEIQRRANAK
jgi:hypothetical protein